MQQFIRSNSFFIPLCGLSLGIIWIHCPWANPFFTFSCIRYGGQAIPFSIWGIALFFVSTILFWSLVWPKYRSINPQLRMGSVFFFNTAIALQFFGSEMGDKNLWKQEPLQKLALVSITDTLIPNAKGHAGEIGCLGFLDSKGAFYPHSLHFRVSLPKGVSPPAVGSVYHVPVQALRPYVNSTIPGSVQWDDIMQTLGIDGNLRWDTTFLFAGRRPIGRVLSIKLRFLSAVRKQLFDNLTPDQAGLVYAMLIGDKAGLEPQIEKQFAIGGLMHVLAVSGMHVALIMGALMWLLTRIGGRTKPGVTALIVLILMGWVYAWITGSGASVIRAMLGATWVWVGNYGFRRKQHLMHVLLGSAYIQVLWNPYVIFQLGFQLSYLAVLGIGTLHDIWSKQWKTPHKWLNILLLNISLTLTATLFTAPLMLLHFHSFPTWFLLGNLLLLPLFTIAVYVGLLCLFLGWIPYVGYFLYCGFAFFLKGLLLVLHCGESLPLKQLKTLEIGWWEAILMWLCLACGYKIFKKMGKRNLLRYNAKYCVKSKKKNTGNHSLNAHNSSAVSLIQAPKKPTKFHSWPLALLLAGVFVLISGIEYKRVQRIKQAHSFVIIRFNKQWNCHKKGDTLFIRGNVSRIKSRQFLMKELQSYISLYAVHTVLWVQE